MEEREREKVMGQGCAERRRGRGERGELDASEIGKGRLEIGANRA